MEDSRIIAEVRSGNIEAFAAIVEHYQSPILHYLYQLTGNYETSRDLMQDTFLQAYRGILKTGEIHSFKAWLYRIATNNALQFLRRKRWRSFFPLKENLQAGNQAGGDPGELMDTQMAIREAMRRIPAEQRVCLVLHFVEGFKYEEIAGALGISSEAVRKRVARGRQEFRRLYRLGG